MEIFHIQILGTVRGEPPFRPGSDGVCPRWEGGLSLLCLSLAIASLKLSVDLVPGKDSRFLGSDLTVPPIVLDPFIFIVLFQVVSLVKALGHCTV